MSVAHAASGVRRPRRLRRVLLGALAALGLLALGYTLRAPLLGPLLVRQLAEHVRAEFGAELTVERVGGDWLHELVLEGVRWRAERGPLVALDEGRVAVRYSLVDLVRGEPDWLAALSVGGRGLELAPERKTSGGGGALPVLPEFVFELDDVLVHAGPLAPVHLDRLSARGALAPDGLLLDELAAVAGANHVELRAAEVPLAPLATADLAALVRGARGELTLSLPEARALALTADRPWPIVSAELGLALAQGKAEVHGRCELEGGRVVCERGALALPPDGGFERTELDLVLQMDFADLAPLGALLGRPLGGRWLGELDVRGPLRTPTGRFVGRGENVELFGLALTGVELDLETDGERARVARAHATGPGLEFTASGAVVLEPLALDELALEARLSDPGLLAHLPFACSELAGTARLSGPPGAPHGPFDARVRDVVAGELSVGEASARGTLAGTALEIEELALTAGAASVRAAGRVERADAGLTAELTRLEVEWRGARCTSTRPARIAVNGSRVEVRGLELASGDGGAAALELELGERASVRARFAAFDARALAAALLPAGFEVGRLTGELELAYRGGLESASGALEVDGLRPGADEDVWSLSLRGALADGRIVLERGLAESAGGITAELALDAPFDPARPMHLAPGEAHATLALATRDVGPLARFAPGWPLPTTGALRVEAELGGPWNALTGSARVYGRGVAWPADAARLGACDLELVLAFEPERLRLERGELTALHAKATARGTLGLGLDATAAASLPARARTAALELEGDLDLPDVAWLADLARVRRVSGHVSGHMALAGTLAEPRPSGTLALREGELRLSASSTPVRALSADLEFEGQSVRVRSLTGEVGGAPVSVTGTLAPFGDEPDFELELTGSNLLLARSASLRLRADAALTLRGPVSRPRIGGALVLTEGRFTGEIDPLERIAEVGRRSGPGSGRIAFWTDAPLAQAELDVRITCARPIAVRTNLLQASLRPECRLLGTGAAPTAAGSIYVDEADLSLPSGKMKLVSGLLQLREDQPFRPTLALTAEERTQGYDVRASVTGSWSELEVTLSSSPPLSSDDLWILVITGQPPLDSRGDRSKEAMEAVALFLARDKLVRWFSADPDDTAALLDRFEIDVGAKTSQSGQPTGRVLFYMKPDSARARRATYLSAELDEYDRVNFALGLVFRPR